jgi:NACHT domain-containing protein
MLSWLATNIFTISLLGCFLIVLGYALWLRYRMAVSKARFALAVVATLASCAIALLTFISGPIPIQIINAGLSSIKSLTGIAVVPFSMDGPNWFAATIGFASTVIALLLIYSFSIRALVNWDGPVTVTVNELAKRELDNSLAYLAFAEARRLVASKPDPLASETAINWQQKQSEAPSTPAWPLLARNLFEAAFGEALFAEKSWRDRFQTWVGEMYVSRPHPSDTAPLLLFVFDYEPTDEILSRHIDAFSADGALLAESKVFAVFYEGPANEERKVTLSNITIEIWPRRALLRKGLRLTSYARDLIRRFDKDVLGGTKATLRDTFVPAHTKGKEEAKRVSLDLILSEWIQDKSRRHLAITGEYGQGKSTAMLNLCVKWAERYLVHGAVDERIPLLIELRGQNPAESDPVAFLSTWAGRYGLPPKQVYNLIKAGDAILIFEGFDELRNAGRAYDRQEHFNALWRMAFPGTKIIFTGRPNFFLDENEKNRTLRADTMRGAAGNAFTQVWELDRLIESEVRQVVYGFGETLGQAIMAAANAHPAFFEIVSRPSMLPVVATIWDTIEGLQRRERGLTSAILLERYLQAVYRRKEEEVERDQQIHAAPTGASYLLLPREVREVFTLAIVWRMVDSDARNTISRSSFDSVISQLYDDVFKIFQTEGVRPDITRRVREFEERFSEETKADRIERVSNEVASAGVFVPDPAGGPSNLRLPHKQFYEYMIAKVAWIVLARRTTLTCKLFRSIERRKNPFHKLLAEDLSVHFFGEIIGSDFTTIRSRWLQVFLSMLLFHNKVEAGLRSLSKRLVAKVDTSESYFVERDRPISSRRAMFLLMQIVTLSMATTMLVAVALRAVMAMLWPMITSRPLPRLTVAIFETASMMLLMLVLMTAVVAAMRSVTPRMATLRKIVYERLRKLPQFAHDRLPIIILHRECWLVVSSSSNSIINQWFKDKSGQGEMERGTQRELRELIAPLA